VGNIRRKYLPQPAPNSTMASPPLPSSSNIVVSAIASDPPPTVQGDKKTGVNGKSLRQGKVSFGWQKISASVAAHCSSK